MGRYHPSMIMPDPHWTAYVSALLLPTVAGFAGWIAHQQAQTARAKLKLDLFERRLAVRNAVYEWISASLNNPIRDEQDGKFFTACNEAKWLFDSEIYQYLQDTLWDSRCRLMELDVQVGEGGGPDHAAMIKERAALVKWLFAQRGDLDEKLAPYLSFAAWK